MRIVLGIVLLAAIGGCESTDSRDSSSRARTDELRRERESAMRETGAVAAIVPAGNVRVNIERHEFDARDRSAIDAFFRYRDDRAKVAVGEADAGRGRGGLRVAAMSDRISGGAGGVKVSGESRVESRRVTQFLLMMPGSQASMQVTTTAAEPWVVVVPVRDGGGAALVEMRRVLVNGSGMDVTVDRVEDGAADLTLRPYFDAAADGGRVRVHELTTRVRVPAGRRVAIYAERSDEQTLAESWLSVREATTTRQTIVVLWVDLP